MPNTLQPAPPCHAAGCVGRPRERGHGRSAPALCGSFARTSRRCGHAVAGRPAGLRLHTIVCIAVAVAALWAPALAMRTHPASAAAPWCSVATSPHWPFAYSKVPEQTVESKGRTASNQQSLGHECTTRGARSKCNRCEPFLCAGGTAQCELQFQGADWAAQAHNVPTVSDTPWAVGGAHRQDYAEAQRICLMLSRGHCVEPWHSDYSNCSVRCWGANATAPPTPSRWGWEHSKGERQAQGRVRTLAGGAGRGFRDGVGSDALFDRPQGVAVAQNGSVFVADTFNHAVRRVDPDGTVTTVAGVGEAGYADGPALQAMFSHPVGLDVFHDPAAGGELVVIVADTDNHRIRRIAGGRVRTLAGLAATPHSRPGYADGSAAEARFNHPSDVAVTDDGVVFVADSNNHLVRWITPDGHTRTLAGRVEHADDTPGCPAPCLRGVAGFRDGNLTHAEFHFPSGVALGRSGTVIVTDGHRVRRISLPDQLTRVQGVRSRNRVTTVAGTVAAGEEDGAGDASRFNAPRGVAMSADGHVFVADSSSCRIRRIARALHVALPVTCSTRLVDVVRPSGCASYDPPVDALDFAASAVAGHVHYNQGSRQGLRVARCQGSAPPTRGMRSTGVTDGPNNGTRWEWFTADEQSDAGTLLRVRCPADCFREVQQRGGLADVWGTGMYADFSSVCQAALHAGVLRNSSASPLTGGGDSGRLGDAVSNCTMAANGTDGTDGTARCNGTAGEEPWGGWDGDEAAQGMLVTLRITRDALQVLGTAAHGVQSQAWPESLPRTFVVEPYAVSELQVETLAGVPAAPLAAPLPCGYRDTQPPQEAKFSLPSDVAVRRGSGPTDTEEMVIADTENNAIRAMTAVCTRVCENGGVCVGSNTCACPNGWAGEDCGLAVCASPCPSRHVCTAPDTCTCVPGFAGPSCTVALCMQECVHGSCVAPDTCACDFGWFDVNCTTPVCAQTCGNGGNCTAPNTCTCPQHWAGHDCRTPVCSQACLNGGTCVAPDTCLCPPEWSGHDCSKPVCLQGVFVPDPAPQFSAASEWREADWVAYLPCRFQDWCAATRDFDCAQHARSTQGMVPPHGGAARAVSGWRDLPVGWEDVAAGEADRQQCLALEVAASAQTHFRYVVANGSVTPYALRSPLAPYEWDGNGEWRAPSPADADRQVAWAELRRVRQGVYVCANGGNCTAPGICRCPPGWVGFDCRTPVCRQGYFEEGQDGRAPLNAHRHPGWAGHAAGQGAYECSIRAHTQWEWRWCSGGQCAQYVHNHPNFYSRYMDDRPAYQQYGVPLRTGMGWPATHERLPPLGDNTRLGWQRDGWWQRVAGAVWVKGVCTVEFQRMCPGEAGKAARLFGGLNATVTEDTEDTFAPVVTYGTYAVDAVGRWDAAGGECVDHVLRGCFNNGTCVAPGQCQCAPGWSGHDCKTPVCEQACLHGGNCTAPNTCTCELGWSGHDCSQALCAQECRNGGHCAAPDVCECARWPSAWVDRRLHGGRPLYRDPAGNSQLTGWTGYDCNTPICTQAQRFVLNDAAGSTRLGGNSLILYSDPPTNNLAGQSAPPPYTYPLPLPVGTGVLTTNNGRSFQSGCIPTSARFSETSLCNVLTWQQGDYLQGRSPRANHPFFVRAGPGAEQWVQGPVATGEGIYACYNRGSCVAPDTCSCPDGWAGHDCNTPLCRHRNAYGDVVSCQNGGLCSRKDRCTCVQTTSILHRAHPELDSAFMTGYTGSDCSIPKCVQGHFELACTSVASGGEGCFRCANGGNCTAPDYCSCHHDWRGYDCREPICTVSASLDVIRHLKTVDPAKVAAFEQDPCRSGVTVFDPYADMERPVGNCSAPNVCECLCMHRGEPWKDFFKRSIPWGYTFGTGDCESGFEGLRNEDGTFRTCHLRIYEPTWFERYTLMVGTVTAFTLFFVITCMMYCRRRLVQRSLAKKAERRRSRRSSEQEPVQAPKSAFGHA